MSPERLAEIRWLSARAIERSYDRGVATALADLLAEVDRLAKEVELLRENCLSTYESWRIAKAECSTLEDLMAQVEARKAAGKGPF